MFEDKVLLITGGTGSFGHTVLKRFLDTAVNEIRIFSRDEKKQEDMRIALGNDKVKFYIGDVATVQIGPDMRRGIAELNGEGEVAGGVIVMRQGKNAREVIEDVRTKLAELKASLPPGVEIVTTYDRSGLIDRAVENLTGTPILNPGEAAIMAFGAIRKQPWVVTAADGSDELAIRHVTTLGLSFDHRLVDGELGSRYLADVAAILADPARAFIWG